MGDAQEEQKVFDFPLSVREAFDQREDIDKEIKRLKKRYEGLSNFIAESVPPTETDKKTGNKFGVKEGIKVSRWVQKSYSYKKAIDMIMTVLLPKTRWKEAELIIGKNVTETPRVTITEVEPEE
jgi:hypothetical protein